MIILTNNHHFTLSLEDAFYEKLQGVSNCPPSRFRVKKTWEIIKESIEKGYCNHQTFPKKLVIDKENITHEGLNTKHFNTYFFSNSNKSCTND